MSTQRTTGLPRTFLTTWRRSSTPSKDSGERTTHVDCLRSETGSSKVNEYAIEAISFVFGANALSIKLVAIV